MAKCRVVKQFRFEAAHHLPNHNGQCRRPHGHSYLLEVCVIGHTKPANGSSSEGMVIDFADMSAVVKEVIVNKVDHYNLNEVVPAQYQPTTAENIATWIFWILHTRLSDLMWVRVWETSTAYAEVRREDMQWTPLGSPIK